jgi:outer membrane protein
MKVSLHSVVKLLVAGGALAAAAGASAQSAGQWSVALGANRITPHVESGDITASALPHSKADVGRDTEPVLVFSYGLSDNLIGEMAIGPRYKHKLYGAGALAGTGEIATVEALPPTACLQYRFFEPGALIRPFLGAGITYAHFQKATGSGKLTALTNPGSSTPTTFKVDNKLTASVEAGVVVNLNERWFADVTLVKTRLRTDVHYSTGQNQHMKLDPQSLMLSVGYNF